MKYKVTLYQKRVPDEQILKDLRSVSKKTGSNHVSRKLYKLYGTYSDCTVLEHFATWDSALINAGLEPYNGGKIPEIALLKNMENLWNKLNRQPVKRDLVKPVSQYSIHCYRQTFGSWNKALLAFEKYTQNKNKYLKELKKKEEIAAEEKQRKTEQFKLKKRGSRNIGYRLRYIVLERDRHKCRSCGSSPADDGNVKLEIDHIIPWSKGGESVLNNLQTLCRACNIGKGNR